MLEEAECEPITTIVFDCAPSSKGGLSEGEYSKRYLLERPPKLSEFPRFADRLDADTLASLKARPEKIIITKELVRSIDEVVEVSRIFAGHEVSKVY